MRTVVLAALLALIAATPAAAAEYRAAPGRVTFALPPEHPYIPSIEAVAALPGGASIVAGTSGRRAFVARIRADGGLDRGYGRSGIAYPDGIFVAGIAVTGDGSVTVVMDARAGASPPPRLVRLDPGGKVDRGYGDGGKLDLAKLNGEGPVAATPDGGVIVAGSRDDDKASAAVRVTPGGAIDMGFGGGLAPIENGAAALAVQPDGRVLVAGERPGDEDTALHSVLTRLDAAGAPEPSYRVELPLTTGVAPVFDAEGRALVAGTNARTARGAAVRVLPDGALDPTFSASARDLPANPVALFALPDGALVAGTDRDASVRLARLGADGAAVAGSGTRVGLGGGSVDDRRLGGGFYTLAGGALRPDGSVLLAGSAGLMGPADEEGDGGDIYTQPALIALRQRGGLVRGFGRVTRAPRVRVRVTVSGAVRVRSSARGLARVTVRRGGRTLARRYVLFRRAGWHTAARVRPGGRVTVRVAADDMAGNLRRVRAVR